MVDSISLLLSPINFDEAAAAAGAPNIGPECQPWVSILELHNAYMIQVLVQIPELL